MSYLGDFAPTAVVPFWFSTKSASLVPTTLAGSPVISIYKKGSTTQSTTGVTLTADYDTTTGLNYVEVDTSADGTFYAAGNDFALVITTGTIGGSSIAPEVIAEFSLNNRTALRPATAGRTIVVDAAGLADANAVKVGPSGSGTAQTARDIGASVLIAAGQLAIKKNVQLTAFTFPMFAAADHVTPLTGLTVTGTRSIDGGAFGACANAVAEIGTTGWYKITLANTDLNGTVIALSFTGGVTADPQSFTLVTQA